MPWESKQDFKEESERLNKKRPWWLFLWNMKSLKTSPPTPILSNGDEQNAELMIAIINMSFICY